MPFVLWASQKFSTKPPAGFLMVTHRVSQIVGKFGAPKNEIRRTALTNNKMQPLNAHTIRSTFGRGEPAKKAAGAYNASVHGLKNR